MFHMVILVYATKGINFGDDTYVMCIQLAALDWVCLSHLLRIAFGGEGVSLILLCGNMLLDRVWLYRRTALNRTNNYMQV